MLVAGNGSEVNNCGGAVCHRWGDYSSISVDPADGCTFWYTNEYFTSQTAGNGGTWNTRIGSFAFPSCTSSAPTTVTKKFHSVASQDGWVLESGPNTHVGGGSPNSGAGTLRLGDDAADRQYRSILSFNTSGLPNNAVIKSVKFRIHKAGLVGANPFDTLGNIVADIRKGSFGGNAALQAGDFQATANRWVVLTFTNSPVGGWYTRALSSANFGFINLAGYTQFRLRFTTPSNNNSAANYLKLQSGNYMTTPALRPTLIITYSVP